ncbi:AAA family ATPase [Desulfovibrio sp. OttesenSCG-928-F20]|nr:AAA family ATPase [Desulfovibrio sp. OttesenSCG-928-F20]
MSSPSLLDLFEQYRADNNDEAWRNRYKAVSSQIEEIRDGRQQLTSDFVKQIWTAQHFGPASVSQGVVPAKAFASLEALLTDITRMIIDDPSPSTLSKVLSRFEQARTEGHISWTPWAITQRLMAAAAPRRYSSVVAKSYFRPLHDWLRDAYHLGIPDNSYNWAAKDSAMRAELIRLGLPDADPFLLNSFVWELAYRFVPKEKSASSEQGSDAEAEVENESAPAGHIDFPPALNTMYYGPPGTGKTHVALQMLKAHFTSRGKEVTREEWEESLVRDLFWRDVVAAVLSDLGGQSTVPALCKHPLIAAKYRIMSGNKNSRARIWGNLQMHSSLDSKTVNYTNKRPPALFDKLDDGASTWRLLADWAEEATDASALLESYKGGPPALSADEPRFVCVTFHQSYSYEDFIEGIRPVLGDEEQEGDLAYVLKDGLFKELCAAARRDPDRPWALFIDECNRGNIAKIFGELIALIEDNKREGTAQAMSVRLPYSGEKFSIPGNLYIIGAMNTADRSLAFLDMALRRRFAFRRIDPDPSLLPCKEIGNIRLDRLLECINDRITALYDKDHCIGHSYLWNVTDMETLRRAFLDRIIPLLEEYFFDDWEKVRLVLGDTQKAARGMGEHCFLMRKESSEQLFGGDSGNLRLAPQWIYNTEALGNPTAYIAVYDPAAVAKG